MMKRIVIIAMVLVVLGLGMFWGYRRFVGGGEPLRLDIQERPAASRSIVAVLEETGTIRPKNEVVIKSEVNGRVNAAYVQDGDVVTAGCVLVELDKVDLQNRRKELELDHKEALLNYEQTQLLFNRKRQLFERKLISPDEYDTARIDCDLKSNRVAKIMSQINTVDDSLRKTTITAPASGTVVSRAIEEGEVVIGASSVSSGTEMMKIADLGVLEVRSVVNEVDVSSMCTGMLVRVTTDCLPGQSYTGVVERVAPVAETDAASQVQGFEVLVLLEGTYTQLKPGMTANLTYIRAAVSNAVVVPLSAVFCDDYELALADQKFYVFVKTPTNHTKTFVALGIQDAEGVQVVSGLTERVVVAIERPEVATERPKPKVREREH